MKTTIFELLEQALASLQADAVLPADAFPEFTVERTRDKSHGDFATNLAMVLAKPAKRRPRDLADALVAALPAHPEIERVEIAGPGFINFFVRESSIYRVVIDILAQRTTFGSSRAGAGRRVQVEFVSANPTGPLHVGHGRGAAYGATVANLLEAIGCEVEREYYVNDAGRQMDILAVSVWLRYLQQRGIDVPFPTNGYRGDYVVDYAAELARELGDELVCTPGELHEGVPADAPHGDKETHIDGLIARCKAHAGNDYERIFRVGLDGILADIREDLAEFGVTYDCWFSERSLTAPPSQVDEVIELLRAAGHVVERDGALWFTSSQFGDDKDRVVRRDNGQTTYFASDIAYHRNKLERGFDRVVDVWGADHHGYIARVRAALTALGYDAGRLDIRLVQFVSLYRGSEQVAMSTRSGEFVTLRQLRDEVSDDAARFFYITRKPEQAMDFDLELAKSTTKDNPVYYIQYAHARVCSVMRKLAEQGLAFDRSVTAEQLTVLGEEAEKDLVTRLARYPEVLEAAATQCEPHQLATYLRELAGEFHTWYNAHKVIADDASLRNARLALSDAVRQVIANGLTLLGVTAPEQM